ncbi:hypothetical protein RRG08_027428 [Elysia crispata]|uniref:Uncharacterized protein n=1 Tax=Elysia crispata TaxID=231223 RepID=A0AAE0YG51_9GAST|nr:hypothetical protein RRG08_027428 [Elysia crispata]
MMNFFLNGGLSQDYPFLTPPSNFSTAYVSLIILTSHKSLGDFCMETMALGRDTTRVYWLRFISDGTETAGDGVGYFGDVWSVDDDAGSVCTPRIGLRSSPAQAIDVSEDWEDGVR